MTISIKNLSSKTYNMVWKKNSKFGGFHNEFKEILNHYAPIKQSKPRGSTKPYINKTLRKELMKRSRLKDKATKLGKEENKRPYNIQAKILYRVPYIISLIQGNKDTKQRQNDNCWKWWKVN